jgi:hypothetical protein
MCIRVSALFSVFDAAAAFKAVGEGFVTLPLLIATSRHLQTSNFRRVVRRA